MMKLGEFAWVNWAAPKEQRIGTCEPVKNLSGIRTSL